eukprot:Phypoly_transcript_03014.p1 GENE.Phypoly_transcript_03014~~Phypoly_transcript_03014.p1  ORF type:complete len:752 (+),score=129.91 Phypoly_transcript_03014:328-2583(+)
MLRIPSRAISKFHSNWAIPSSHRRTFATTPEGGVVKNVPITKVILYKHGVGYFERKCTVENNQKVMLAFRNTDMNDMLKTLSVREVTKDGSPSEGAITSIEYHSRLDPIREMSDISINLTNGGDKTMAGLLPQLKGVEVELQTTNSRTLRGVVMGIENKTVKKQITTLTPEGHQVTREEISACDFVTLLCEQGNPASTFIQAAELSDVSKLTILDNLINADVTRLLDLFRTTKKNNLKDLTIHTKGSGSREIQASYIVETPVWKATYKISLFSDPAKPVRIVGSALVDNVQEDPWDNVQLSLITGFPVSFKYDLYAPKYRNRPFLVPPEDGAPVDSIMSPMETKPYSPPPPQHAAAWGHAVAKKGRGGGGARREKPQKTESPGLAKSSDFCKWDVKHPVNVASHGSALVPLMDSNVEGKRVVIFDPKVRKTYPMSAILFKNTSGYQIEAGPAYIDDDGVYVGEVMLQNVQVGEETVIPYAIDQGCTIKVDKAEAIDQPKPYSAKCQNGMLQWYKKSVTLHTYAIANGTNRTIPLIIDHPIIAEGEIDRNDPRLMEITDTFARYKMDQAAFSESELVVVENADIFGNSLDLGSDVTQYSKLETLLEGKAVDGDIRNKLEWFLGQYKKSEEIRRQKEETESFLGIANRKVRSILEKLKELRESKKAIAGKEISEQIIDTSDEAALRSKLSAEMIGVEDRIKSYETKLAEITVSQDALLKTIRDEARVFNFEETHPSDERMKMILGKKTDSGNQ